MSANVPSPASSIVLQTEAPDGMIFAVETTVVPEKGGPDFCSRVLSGRAVDHLKPTGNRLSPIAALLRAVWRAWPPALVDEISADDSKVTLRYRVDDWHTITALRATYYRRWKTWHIWFDRQHAKEPVAPVPETLKEAWWKAREG